MRVRKAIKKIAALGVGAGMLATTLLGATAADLGNFPKPLFINDDGTFNGKFVVGKLADAEDILGVNAITAAVQSAAVVKTQVSTGGGEQVTITGDSAQFEASGDILELNERLGDVKEVFTSDDLEALQGGKVTNSKGSTDYNQYLRFETNSSNGATSQVTNTSNYIDSGKVKWDQNDDEDVGDFLYFQDGDAMFEYELEFTEGVKSDQDSDDHLEDLEDRDLNILGNDFTVSQAMVKGTDDYEITLLGGEWQGVMEEGESTTVTIGGTDYDVDVLVITDTPAVKFRINGESTDKLEEAETTVLADGTTIGIREILENEAGEEGMGDIVEFYIGADKVVLRDTDTTDSDFTNDVEVDDETVNGGHVYMKLTNSSDEFTLTDIKYRLEADPMPGETNLLIPEDKGVREFLDDDDERLGMLHEDWDITYKGLSSEDRTDFLIEPSGDKAYDLTFTNVNGDTFSSIPFVDNRNDAMIIGDDKSTDQVLHWVENASNYTISENDYFIVSSQNSTTGVSHALRYESIDTSNHELQFENLATGTVTTTYDSTTKEGDLILGGKAYKVKVEETDGNLTIDLNADGSITDGDKASLILKGGAIAELGTDEAIDELNGNNINVSFTIPATEFDEQGIVNSTTGATTNEAETLWVEVSDAGTNLVDLDLVDSSGPWSSLSDNDFCNLLTLENIDDTRSQCMTAYGVLVEEEEPTGSDSADTFTYSMPSGQVEAQVFVEAGTTTTTTTGGEGTVTTEKVVPIPSTASVLDTEVTSPKSQNLIVVGGPCANSVASALTGVAQTWPECAAGVEAGQAIVKLLDSDDGMAAGKVAMLVYGFNPEDTRLASQIVANYGDYQDKFDGEEELEVTGTSLTDVTIGVPTQTEGNATE